MSYRSVAREAVCERIVEKSRFLGYCAHVAGEEEAREFLSRVRAEHPQATHVCYGFVADKTGNLQRFSDDNEPQGTAGMPILNVIKAQKLFETAVAVVRYFGGIKLGAGGLTRAYRQSAAELIEKVGLAQADRVCVYSLRASADAYKKAAGVLRALGCVADNIEYAAEVVCTVTAPHDADVLGALAPLGVKAEKLGERLIVK